MQLPFPDDQHKPLYARDRAFFVKTGHLINLVCWLLVLIGFIITYKDSPYSFLFDIPVVFVVAYLSLSNIIAFLYKPFSYQSHVDTTADYHATTQTPTIDIFLPVCGESLEVLSNTWHGVNDMQKSYAGSVQVYVLDDKGNAGVQSLAGDYGFNYLSRPNKGVMKKAGNLKYGYEHSNGDFILILDADFRPLPEMLTELVPYMQDETVGIVQSPQFFDLKGLKGLQYGAGNIQRYFYHTIQRARGSIGGSICVGSCALYRRQALDTVGGTYQIEHSEDVWTGYSLIANGWRIQYVPIPLAMGLCPDDFHNFFKQQNRWCNGSMSLMRSALFWSAKVPWYTKLSYISGFMYYLSSPFILLLPIQNFALLYSHRPMHWYLWAFFVPSVVFTTLFMWRHVYGDMKYGTILARMTALWSYTYAILAMLTGQTEGWIPTGEKQALSSGFRRMTLLSTTYFIVYVSLVVVSIANGSLSILDWHYGLTTFWIVTNTIFQGVFMYGLWSYILTRVRTESVEVVPQLVEA